MQYPRLKHFDDGVAMVVTDLHGEGEAYDHIRNTFLDLYEKGVVNRLVICGDLIHIRRNVPDESVRMILDVIDLQQEFGDDTIVMLMGNHEMPHVYNVTLSKGNDEFTAPFEQSLTQSGEREKVSQFLHHLPLYVSTNAGVFISHAGATPVVTDGSQAENILTFDHEALLHLADDRLKNGYDLENLKQNREYFEQVKHYLAVQSVDDPRYHHFLRGQLLSQSDEEFSFLWDVLFARNEQGTSIDRYTYVARHFLLAISNIVGIPLNVIVAGHIGTKGGHALIGRKHLRLSSFAHAHPNHSGEYLLLDCANLVQNSSDLLPYLRPVFP